MDGKVDQIPLPPDTREERFAALKLVAEKAIIRDQIRRWMIDDFKLRGIRLA